MLASTSRAIGLVVAVVAGLAGVAALVVVVFAARLFHEPVEDVGVFVVDLLLNGRAVRVGDIPRIFPD